MYRKLFAETTYQNERKRIKQKNECNEKIVKVRPKLKIINDKESIVKSSGKGNYKRQSAPKKTSIKNRKRAKKRKPWNKMSK